MSREIDERIVKMQFDNAQFESGVRTTIGTLEKFKQSLSFGNLGSSGMATLEKNVQNISDRFSTLGIVAATALQRIANKAIDVGETVGKALTIQGAMDGWREYELTINSVKTILNSAKDKNGLPVTLEQVNKSLNELNQYADRTIYSFSDMTTNIGKFTNAGVDLETAVGAIQGVANVAAVSGANAQNASHAMYNFAQALSAGYVKLIDWKSIEIANMGTVDFKNQLLETALALGTVKKQGDSYVTTTTNLNGKTSEALSATAMFSDGLQHQWLTTDVLIQTLNKYSDTTTDIGKKAAQAATEINTLTQLIGVFQEAIGSGWAQTWQIITGDYEESKKLWTGISNAISPIIEAQTKTRNDMLTVWKNLSGRNDLIEGLTNIAEIVGKIFKIASGTRSTFFPATTGKELAEITSHFKEFTETLRLSGKNARKFQRVFSGFFGIFDIAKSAVSGFTNAVGDHLWTFRAFGNLILDVSAFIGDFFRNIAFSVKEGNAFYHFFSILITAFGIARQAASALWDTISPFLTKFFDAEGIAKRLSSGLKGIDEWINHLAGDLAANNVFHRFFESAEKPLSFFIALFDKAKESVAAFFASLRASVITRVIGGSGHAGSFGDEINTLTKGGHKSLLGSFARFLGEICSGLKKIGPLVGTIFSTLGNVLDGFSIERTFELLQQFMTIGVGAGIARIFHNMAGIVSEAKGFTKNISDIIDGVTGSLEAFQTKLKAEALAPIAIAIGVLTASLIALSSVDHDKLSSSLGILAVMFAQLGLFMAAFTKIVSSPTKLTRGGGIKDQLGGLIASLTGFGGGQSELKSAAIALIGITASIRILASSIIALSTLNWEQVVNGLKGVGILMAELAVFMAATSWTKFSMSKGVGLIAFAQSFKMLASAITSLGALDWTQVVNGLKGVGILMAELAVFIAATSWTKFSMSKGVGLIAFAAALKIIASVISSLGQLPWSAAKTGLLMLGGALLEVAIAVNLLRHALLGAASLLVAAAAITVLTVSLKALGKMSKTEVATSLIALAGAFAVIGVASAVLAPIIPVVLAFGAAIALVGVGIAAFAVAVTGLVPALTSLISAVAAIALGPALTSIGAGIVVMVGAIGAAVTLAISDFIGLIPAIGVAVGEAFIAIIGVMADSTEAVKDAAIKIGLALLEALAVLAPALVYMVVAITGDCIDALVQALDDHGEQIWNAVQKLILFVLTAAVDLINSLVSEIPVLGDLLSPYLTELSDSLHDTLSRERGEEIVEEFFEGMDGSGRAGKFGDTVKEEIDGALTEVETTVREDGAKITDAASDVTEDTVNAVDEKAKPLKTLPRKHIDETASTIREEGGEVTDAVNDVAEDAVDAAESHSGEFSSTGNLWVDATLKGVQDPAKRAELLSAVKENPEAAVSLLLEYQDDFSDAGEADISSYGSGLSNGTDEAEGGAGEIVTVVLNKLGEASDKTPGLGQNTAIGFSTGMTSEKSKGSIIGAASKFIGWAMGTITSRMEMHSPSKVTYRMGEFTSMGYAEGLSDSSGLMDGPTAEIVDKVIAILSYLPPNAKETGELTAALFAEGLADSSGLMDRTVEIIVDSYLSRIEDIPEATEAAVAGATAAISKLPTAYERVSEQVAVALREYDEENREDLTEAEKAAKEAQRKAEQRMSSMYSSLQTWVNRTVKFEKLSSKEQLDIWEAILSQFDRETDNWWSAYEKVFDLREAALQEAYNAEKERYEQYIEDNESTTKEQIALWYELRDATIEGSEQRLEVEKKIAEIEKQLRKEEKEGLESHLKTIEDINGKIAELEQNYQDKLASRTKEIANSYSLFEEAKIQERVAGSELIANLRSQISAIEHFYSQLNRLERRGATAGLIEELRGMGVSASAQLDALVRMSDAQLNNYVNLYEEKQELANGVALKELESFREKTNTEIREQLALIEDIFETDGPIVGKAFPEGLAKGILSGESMAIEAAVQVAKSVEAAIRNYTDTHSPSGMFCDIAYNGWIAGMVLGLQNGIPVLEHTTNRVGDALCTAFQNAYGEAATAIEYAPDFTPTIRPVLDLSSVYAGGSRLGNIFAPYQGFSIGTSATIAENISLNMEDFNADNRSIVNSLQMLHDDMEDLQEVVGQMQVVLDTGTLVGEMVGPMDAALGRRMNWKGRGM